MLGLGVALVCVHHVVAVAVMSVDLGSEWMKVAVVSPGVPMEIALNPESKRKTSVAVSMKDGERKFGSDAMVVCVKSPKHCYRYLLDLLGKKLDHPAVAAYQARFPMYKLEADPDRGTVVFRHDEDTVYSVEELLGMILAHAKSQAESYTGQTVRCDMIYNTSIHYSSLVTLQGRRDHHSRVLQPGREDGAGGRGPARGAQCSTAYEHAHGSRGKQRTSICALS